MTIRFDLARRLYSIDVDCARFFKPEAIGIFRGNIIDRKALSRAKRIFYDFENGPLFAAPPVHGNRMNFSVRARFKKNVPIFLAVLVDIAGEPYVVETVLFYVFHPPLAEPLERLKPVPRLTLSHGRARNTVEPHAVPQKIHGVLKNVGDRDAAYDPGRDVGLKNRNIKKLYIKSNEMLGRA